MEARIWAWGAGSGSLKQRLALAHKVLRRRLRFLKPSSIRSPQRSLTLRAKKEARRPYMPGKSSCGIKKDRRTPI